MTEKCTCDTNSYPNSFDSTTACQTCVKRSIAVIDNLIVELNHNECDPEVYSKGKLVCWLDIPKQVANYLCEQLTKVVQQQFDWHYNGGRVFLKVLPPQPDLSIVAQALKVLEAHWNNGTFYFNFYCDESFTIGYHEITSRSDDEPVRVIDHQFYSSVGVDELMAYCRNAIAHPENAYVDR